MKWNYQNLTSKEIELLLLKNSIPFIPLSTSQLSPSDEETSDLFEINDREKLLSQLRILIDNQKRLLAYFSNQATAVQEEVVSKSPTLLSTRPQSPEKMNEHFFIQRVRIIVEKNYMDEDFALPQLCKKLRMSRSQVFRKMKNLIGISPSNYIRTFRLHKAKVLLQNSEYNISEVAWRVGYKDLPHFSKSFQNEFGVSPSTFRTN